MLEFMKSGCSYGRFCGRAVVPPSLNLFNSHLTSHKAMFMTTQ